MQLCTQRVCMTANPSFPLMLTMLLFYRQHFSLKITTLKKKKTGKKKFSFPPYMNNTSVISRYEKIN